uniref:KH_dom_type_1 domain-containing protein n=1 Tax=Heligmosomoides polygyrus TaxID=6339 RepID=A0A8L8Q7T5_HELPZ
LKRIEQNSEGRPVITHTRFNPKYEPIVISKSLRTGRLELIVLAGEAKEIEALHKAVESGDEQTIEKVASNNGTISLLVWFPARASDPIKRILHTAATVAATNRARPTPASAAANRNGAASSARVGSASSAKNGATAPARKPVHEAHIQKTTVAPVKGSATSRVNAAAVGKPAVNAVGKASGTVPGAPTGAPEELTEPAPTPVETVPPLDDSVVILDDVVPDICVDAPQDPTSTGLQPPVELIVIPPTPEPTSQSGRSSIDGPPSPAVSPRLDGDKPSTEQNVLPSGDDRRATSGPPPAVADSLPSSEHMASDNDRSGLPSPVVPEQHDDDVDKHVSSPGMPNVPAEYEESPKSPIDSSEPSEPSAPPLSESDRGAEEDSGDPKAASGRETEPQHEDTGKPDIDEASPASPSTSPHAHGDPKSVSPPPFQVDITPAEPFSPPSLRETHAADVVLEGDVPEEFKGPHSPQPVGENGLLDDLEEPPKLMRISMDTDDLKKALEKGASAVADQLAHCLDALSLDSTNDAEKHESNSKEDPAELARKLSQQMVDEASTPFTSALASALTDSADAAKNAAGSVFDSVVGLASTVSEGVKDATEQVQEKTDPIIDSVLETVASDSERVDHALSNGGSGLENKENGRKSENEGHDEGFRVAADSHDMRLYLPPPSTVDILAAAVPHLSRPLFFELATVPHLNGRCTLTDEQSAVEYFTSVRSSNYILHSEDVSPVVLDGWLTGKKHWLNKDLKSRLIPTRHHSALLAFVTANAAEMEEHGLTVNSSLEHNTISLNTDDRREDYHMMKIEL